MWSYRQYFPVDFPSAHSFRGLIENLKSLQYHKTTFPFGILRFHDSIDPSYFPIPFSIHHISWAI